jgi:hypothetical protein
MWENAIWHHGLPFAISALVRQTGAVRFDLIAFSVRTLIATQLDDGRWPSADGSAAFSVWAVWPFLEALADTRTHLALHSGQVLTPLSAHTAMIQDGPDREVTPQRLLSISRWRSRRRWLRRNWATATIGLLLAAGAALVVTGLFDAQEVGFGLVVPVILLAIQVAMTSNRSAEQ